MMAERRTTEKLVEARERAKAAKKVAGSFGGNVADLGFRSASHWKAKGASLFGRGARLPLSESFFPGSRKNT